MKFCVQHLGRAYLSGTDDDEQAEHLPPGQLPVWVERTHKVTDGQVLNFIKERFVTGVNPSVTVLHYGVDPSAKAEEWCGELGWRYLDGAEMFGSEDKCIVLMDATISSEEISRGRNLLVIVTTRGKRRCKTLSSFHSICNAGIMMSSMTLPLSTSLPPTSAQVVTSLLVTGLVAIAHTSAGSCYRR